MVIELCIFKLIVINNLIIKNELTNLIFINLLEDPKNLIYCYFTLRTK